HADEPGPGAGLRGERRDVEPARRLVRNHGIGHAGFPDEARERAGIESSKPDDAAALEPLVEVTGGAIIRWRGDRCPQDDAARPGRRLEVDGLNVVFVGAYVADMLKREGDDLASIDRVVYDLMCTILRQV